MNTFINIFVITGVIVTAGYILEVKKSNEVPVTNIKLIDEECIEVTTKKDHRANICQTFIKEDNCYKCELIVFLKSEGVKL